MALRLCFPLPLFCMFLLSLFLVQNSAVKPHILSLVWGLAFYAYIPFVLFVRGGLKPYTHILMGTHTH